jgi:23S rRNA (uracil1939-C5)-methyltransferase
VAGPGSLLVEIDGIASGGAGVGRLDDGRVVFVHGTAPGDRARIRLVKEKRRWAQGELLRLESPGPGRRRPPCVHAGRCGGCTLQHLEPHVQEEVRGRLVVDALERIGGFRELPPLRFHAAPSELAYRNRLSFTLRRLGRRPGSGTPPLVAGFHALGRPGHVVDVGTEAGGPCLLAEPALVRLWDDLREAWGPDARSLPAGAELRLTLRVLSDGTGILLVEGGGGPGNPEALLAGVPGLRAVWARPGAGGPPRLLAGEEAGEEPGEVAGEVGPMEHWFGEEVPVRPGAFLQTNRGGAEILHTLALASLDPQPGERVVDAYAGFGVYARAVARRGARATGIELDPQAVAMGRARPVEGFDLLEGPVEEVLPGLLPAHRVLLNPPRTGVADGVMESLAAEPPARLVYVSCDPATLARDLARLGPSFRITALDAVDLFPQTAHVESVVTLDRVDTAP